MQPKYGLIYTMFNDVFRTPSIIYDSALHLKRHMRFKYGWIWAILNGVV